MLLVMEVVIVLAWMLWKWDALQDELDHDFDMDALVSGCSW